MLSEYALEPDLLNSYENCRYFLEKFGISKGRIIAQFPTTWLRMVQEVIVREREAGRFSELQYVRIETMLVNIHSALSRWRLDHHYQVADPWLVNAENEHIARPFQAIVAETNPRNRDFVLVGRDLDESQPSWKAGDKIVVPRNPTQLAAIVYPLLRVSETLVFVDRHFGPENGRHRQVFRELMKASIAGRARDPMSVVYFTGTSATNQFFLDTCRDELPRYIPSGLSVRLAKLAERLGSEKFHNRYVLTERGGISLGIGLDPGPAGQTDDAYLLGSEQYVRRWNDYMGVMPSFDLVCSITVNGIARR
jgi:hypothetical protein